MVPSAIIRVETFPVSPNGKIDRQALALPRHPSSAQPSLVAARTETEVAIAAIWADVLKREVIGVEDTFFSVGGNSLQAAQVASRIRRHFSLDLPLRRLYEQPTVALLASEVDRARSTAETKSRFRMNQLSNGYERRPGWGFRRVGHGTSCGHHGEIFQGQLENSHGEAHRCLLSLP